MAISKVVYKSSPSATPVTWMDATSATAAASDITAPKTAMLADGVMTTGTGSSGASNWTLLTSKEYTRSTTDTSQVRIENLELTLSDYNDKNIMLWVHIRDKAGKRNGYFYGHDAIFLSYGLANNSTGNITTKPFVTYYTNSSGAYAGGSASYGVYARGLYYTSDNHYVEIYERYNSGYGTINGTYKVEVYKLTIPTGFLVFD